MSRGKRAAVTHRARRHWFGRGRTRALLALGSVTMLGAVGTSAYWTDTANIDGGEITSGSMDLQLQVPYSATQWFFVGPGDGLKDQNLAISDLTPGESQAFNFAAQNIGQPDFTYTATVAHSADTWTFVNDPIQVQFYAGATARAANTSTYPRTGTCSGTALGSGPVTVTAAPGDPVIPARDTVVPARPLDSGASEQLCAVVSMAKTATSDNQGKTGGLAINFTATQVMQ